MRKLGSASLLLLSTALLTACVRAGVGAPVSVAEAEDSGRADSGRAAFKRALSLFDSGHFREARHDLEQSLKDYSQLRDYQLYFLAQAEDELGNRQRAATLYSEIVGRFPQSIWQPAALLRLATYAWQKEEQTKARRLASRVKRSAGADEETQMRARLLLLRLMELKDPQQAFGSYYDLRTSGPPEAATEARLRQEALRTAHPEMFEHLTPKQLLEEAKARLAEGNTQAAVEILQQNEAAFAGHQLQPDRLLTLARALSASKGIDAASRVYKQLLQQHARSEVAPTALYELAYGFWNRDRDQEAEPLFTRLLRLYPDSQRSAWSLYALARIAEKSARFPAASQRYRKLADGPAPVRLKAEARWRLGWVHYLAGRYEKAARAFAEAARVNGGDVAAALYWQARAAARAEEKRGLLNVPSSRSSYCKLMRTAPESYYAGLSELRLGVRPGQISPGQAKPTALPPLLFARYSFHLERSRELALMGLTEFAARELAAVEQQVRKRGSRAVLSYLMSAYRDIGDYSRSVRAALTLKRSSHKARNPDALPAVFYGYAYPLAYWREVEKLAQAAGMDPCLVLAVMRQESLFNSRAVSPAQALGLMQLLPRTARRVAREQGLAEPITTERLLEPTANLKLGITYLARLIRLTRGSVARALAAYNAGEAALASWESRYPKADEDEFVEYISYPETRSYVKKVLANLRLYHRLYGKATCSAEMPWTSPPVAEDRQLKSLEQVCQ